MEYEGDSDTNCSWFTWEILKGLVQGRENLEIRGQVEATALLRLARILRRVLES